MVSLPLIDEISVSGRTISEVRDDVTARIARFIRSPKVTLSMKNYLSNRVSVIGEVAKPGTYPLKRNGQLLTELLSEAGGRSDKASGRIILLPAPKRPSASEMALASVGVPQVPAASAVQSFGVEIDMDQLLGRVDHNPLLVPLLPGDTIVVPEMGNFEVDGEVIKPGSYKLASRTSAMGAVAAAGGFTYSADVHAVEVIRDVGGGKKAYVTVDLEEAGLRGGKDVRLRDGDIVRVPSQPGLFVRRQIVETLNGVFRGFGVQGQVR
jgi:polysaccharide export outer membrane protein